MLAFLILATTLVAMPATSEAECETGVGTLPGQHAGPPAAWKFPVWYTACLKLPDVRAQLDCALFNLEDWPRLSRYAHANSCVLPRKPGEDRVVFIGDSITDNWSRPEAGGFFPGKPYYNRGIGGHTTSQMLLRFRQDVVSLSPKATVILAGTNDIGGNSGPATIEDIKNNIASMADIAEANGIAVILASLPPVTGESAQQGGGGFSPSPKRIAMTNVINAWLKGYSKQRKIIFVDYFSALATKAGALDVRYTYDGLHPNAAGYAVMAPLAEQAIALALQRKPDPQRHRK